VSHGVFGAMDETTNDGRWKTRAPNGAKVAERGDVDRAKFSNGGIDACVESVDYARDIRRAKVAAFESQRRELFRGELVAARVSEETIDDSGDVTYVKSRRCHSGGPSVPLGFREIIDELVDAFANLEEDVRYRL
jgi:hypothetical protein